MRVKPFLAAAVCAATVAGAGAGAAFAGEVTGNGKDTAGPAHAASICAFSGLNDNPSEAFPENGRTQSFGQLVSKLGPQGGVPGQACNPNTGGEG